MLQSRRLSLSEGKTDSTVVKRKDIRNLLHRYELEFNNFKCRKDILDLTLRSAPIPRLACGKIS